ncbi:hypothetical protein [Nocardia brevicatena]|uniref:hypothetical protein n=1 Tax=Nocardia brevicatena TaxID=37327 RepID=UPI001C3F2DCB|nr:hypothetical protein [Nocardia brevicatena]
MRLVDYARARGVLVIEDDYDGELRYDAAPLPLLAAMAPDVVVHLGTTSKILSPTLGVAGWSPRPRSPRPYWPIAKPPEAVRDRRASCCRPKWPRTATWPATCVGCVA